MGKRWSDMSKQTAIALALVAMAAAPLSASAYGRWGHGHRGGYGGHHSYYRGGYGHGGGHWSGGRWIAGALITGAAIGLVADALRPEPAYYPRSRVVYSQPGVVYYNQPARVVYENGPPVTRVVETRRTVVYDDPYDTRYVRDDGYDGN